MTREEALRLLDSPADLDCYGDDTLLRTWIETWLLEMLYTKRPFGNSGWEYNLAEALGLPVERDEDGYVTSELDYVLLDKKWRELVESILITNP
jgi:hypothetical protein